MADDGIDEVLDDITNRLYDNIIGTNKEEYLSRISLQTKASIVKDNILSMTKEFFDALNKEFKDVKFRYHWVCPSGTLNSEMHHVYSYTYNKEYISDEDDLEDIYERDNGNQLFYRTDIREININIQYFWERKCSLGHLHVVSRLYVVNMPKLLDLVSWFKVGMPVRTIVQQFIPDFFYDPMKVPKKRGRPRKHVHN